MTPLHTTPLHTTDPPNPLGNVPGILPPVVVLTVPPVWTRLVATCAALMLVISVLVALMVYISWRTALFNTARIDEINERLGRIEAQTKRQ